MLQESIGAAYTAMNILLAVIVYIKSGKNVVSRFYLFCIICLTYFGVIGYLFKGASGILLGGALATVAVFVFALLPFFFLHFIVMFIRRHEILKSRFLVMAIYFAGLFSYAMVQMHFIPVPIAPEVGLTQIGYIYFFTWMSIFFCVGVALLYSTIEFFFKRRVRSRLLFTGFALLMLLLPSPFTASLWISIFHGNVEWFFSSSMIALGVSVYFIFRHKIIADTPYDAVKSALSVMNDVVIKTNQDFEIEMAKGAVRQLLGYAENELLGKPFADLVKEKDHISSYLDYVRSGKMREALVDLEVETKTGERLFMNFSFSPLFEGGEPTGFVAVGRNMSEQRKLEEHVRQAQKIESIGTLASGIAHDFNNILTIIQGYIDLIERGGQDSVKFSQSVDAIKIVTRRGTDLVQQILTFARKTDVQQESVEMNGMVAEVVKLLSEMFPRTIGFTLNLDPHLPPIIANTNQIQQALLNLCVNARDAMPQGGRLTIRSAVARGADLRDHFPEAVEEEYTSIAVSDTGVGMDDETRGRVFEPFFTTKGRGHGTGLGLAVVYGVVQTHRGFIDVESTLGKGTTFTMYFPVTVRAPRQEKASGPAEQAVAEGKETILLVEDEELLLDLLKMVLEGNGYHVLTARDGNEAVELYRQHHNGIAIVVSDVGLPNLGGFEAFMEMKKIDPGVKSVFASGYFEPTVKTQMQESGAKNFVQKPYDVKEILQKIRQVIDADNHPSA